MTSWNPGDQQSGQPGQQPGQQPPSYGQQPPSYGQQPPAPNFDKGGQPPAYGQSAQPPAYGQQPPAYGQGGGYAPPPQNQYGNNPYGAPQGGGNQAPGAVGPLSMGNRVVAFIIDYALIAVPLFILYFILAAAFVSTATASFDPNTGEFNSGATTGLGIVLTIIPLLSIAAFLFFAYLLGTKGQTPGKKWMGVKVVDNDSGQPIGFGRAILRYIVQGLSNIVCYAGLWSAWLDGPPEGRYRGWHDKAVNSVVISVK